MLAEIASTPSLPDVLDIEHFVPFLREFGVVVTILFILLIFLLLMGSYIVFRQAQTLEAQGKDVRLMLANQTAILKALESMQQSIAGFSDFDKDSIAHFKQRCELIATKLEDIACDIDINASASQAIAESTNLICEKTRDIFEYFIKKGGT